MTCPSKTIITELGKKWNLHIIRELEEKKVLRFNEIVTSIRITPKVLDKRLKELVGLGIVDVKRYAETPPRVEYSLTKKGVELVKCFASLDKWVKKYS